MPEPYSEDMSSMLLQGAGDAGEGRVQLRAEALHDRDDRDRDAGGDEAILDGGRARLILYKTHNEAFHLAAP